MGKYIRMTKTYLVLVTVFILARFFLEAVGPEYIVLRGNEIRFDSIVSEISFTRLLFVIPVLLGVRFTRESLGGWKEMLIANFTYVSWGSILLIAAHVVDDALTLGTHYGRGAFVGTTIGQFISTVGWEMHAGPPVEPLPTRLFCTSILLMTIVTSMLCSITIKLKGNLKAAQEKSD